MPEIKYQRLTRSRGRNTFAVAFQSRSSLWLGPDHLLCVDSSGYTESYKRFYFRDIQAITIQESKRRVVWNAIMVAPIVCCLSGLLMSLVSTPKNEPLIIVWLVLSSVLMLFFLINNILGTACVCYLRTAVQIEKLPSLCRLPKTRRVLRRIRPLIVAAQGGELSPEAISARIRDWALSSAGASPAKAVADEPDVPPRLDS